MTSAAPPVLDIYARVSRLGDKRQRPIAGQVKDCKARVAERGAVLGKILDQDRGRSAWNPRVHRPDWDELMHRLETGLSNGVVVFDLARFSRQPLEGERLIAAAERGLLVLDSEAEFDLTTPSGKKAFRDQLTAAAYESDRTSTRSKRGKKLKALGGEPNHTQRPFGFEPDGVTHRKPEAAVIRELAQRLLDGVPLMTLANELNDRGVRSSKGGQWTSVTLRQLLTRERNGGHVVHLGEIVAKLPGDPVLDEETYSAVQALFTARRRGRPISGTYLCTALSHCGRCGHPLSGRPRPHLTPYPDGEIRRQYWCKKQDGGCGRLCVDQRELDRHVGALVVAVLSDPRHAVAVEQAAERARGEQAQRQKIDAQIAQLEETAMELAGRLGRGEIPLARHDAAAAPLDARIAKLRTELASLASDPLGELSPDQARATRAEWSARWEAAGSLERRTLIRQALRGRRLVVNPADLKAARRFDPKRVTIVDPKS